MSNEEKIKVFIDDRPNPFLKRFVVKTINDNKMSLKWSDKTEPEKYYSICFKTIDGELNLRKGLQEYYLQWQIANNLLGLEDPKSDSIVALMQESGVFSIEYTALVKEFNESGSWNDTKFEKLWSKYESK